jgi:hypothetical protein
MPWVQNKNLKCKPTTSNYKSSPTKFINLFLLLLKHHPGGVIITNEKNVFKSNK